MVAFVMSLRWRHVGSVGEAVRVLRQEGVLWTPPLRVSAQAVHQRLRTLLHARRQCAQFAQD